MKKFVLVFVILIISGLSIYYLIDAGFYPIVIINGKFISERSFNKVADSAQYYYSQAIKTYAEQEHGNAKAITIELRRALLDKIVKDVLVAQELETKLGGQVPELVDAKLNNLKINEREFNQAVATVYGLDFEKFKELVLVPQAKEEILQANFQSSADFDAWLKNGRQSASVIILAPDLEWNGEGVVGR